MMSVLHKIASKADYISAISRDIAYGECREPIPTHLLAEILRQLGNIADTLDAYCTTFDEDDKEDG